MYSWYKNSGRCFVYLSNVSAGYQYGSELFHMDSLPIWKSSRLAVFFHGLEHDNADGASRLSPVGDSEEKIAVAKKLGVRLHRRRRMEDGDYEWKRRAVI
jgi:hypothetical protein